MLSHFHWGAICGIPVITRHYAYNVINKRLPKIGECWPPSAGMSGMLVWGTDSPLWRHFWNESWENVVGMTQKKLSIFRGMTACRTVDVFCWPDFDAQNP